MFEKKCIINILTKKFKKIKYFKCLYKQHKKNQNRVNIAPRLVIAIKSV